MHDDVTFEHSSNWDAHSSMSAQLKPLPENPGKHEHVKLPSVSVQFEVLFPAQLFSVELLHSSAQ